MLAGLLFKVSYDLREYGLQVSGGGDADGGCLRVAERRCDY
jgi:hypothetical protein